MDSSNEEKLLLVGTLANNVEDRFKKIFKNLGLSTTAINRITKDWQKYKNIINSALFK